MIALANMPTAWAMDYARLPEIGYDQDDFAGEASPLQRAVDFLRARKAQRSCHRASMPGPPDPSVLVADAPCGLSQGGCTGHFALTGAGRLRCTSCWTDGGED